MKEPSDKLLLPVTAQALNEAQLEPKDATPWQNHPSDEFLYESLSKCQRKNKTTRYPWMKTLNHYFSPYDVDILLRLIAMRKVHFHCYIITYLFSDNE